jgi:AcrR family transcriptional regulator
MVSKRSVTHRHVEQDGGRAVGRRATYHHGDLRAALVTAALELVAEKGVAGLSVAEAARRAGVSSAAPYRHFAARSALLSAAATAAGRRLSEQMQEAVEKVRASGTGGGDPVTQAVETLATLAAVYVRYTLDHGAAFELILADELQDFPDEERRDVTRALFDQLLWPAITVAGDVHAANPLLRSFTAVVHGYAYLPRGGFTRGFPTDMRGLPTETDLVADEAARAVRTLSRAAAERTHGSSAPDA